MLVSSLGSINAIVCVKGQRTRDVVPTEARIIGVSIREWGIFMSGNEFCVISPHRQLGGTN